MREIFTLFLFIVTVADFYYNYNEKEFPDFHRARLYSDLISFLSILLPLVMMLVICLNAILLMVQWINNIIAEKCTLVMTFLYVLLTIFFSFTSSIFQIYSIYLYFKYDGSTKITKTIIKILMWITLINVGIQTFYAICDLISLLKKKKKESNEEMIELEDQNKI